MEKKLMPMSGWIMLLVELILLAVLVALALNVASVWAAVGLGFGCLLFFFLAVGLIAVEPNNSRVMTLFGKYAGTVKSDGFFWVNPFYLTKKDFAAGL